MPAIELTVPSIVCDGCVSTITSSIQKQDPAAKVAADVETKQIVVETTASAESIRQAIVETGHEVA